MKVLLLNRDETLLSVIPWQEAVKLHFQGKVETPYNFNDFYDIKVKNGVYKLPSAVVLSEYVHVPYTTAPLSKRNVLKRDSYTCGYCGIVLSDSQGTIDHIIPQSRWYKFKEQGKATGKHANNWKNVVASCKKCNCKKADRTPNEAGMDLNINPYTPSRMFINYSTYKENENWQRWVKTN